MLKRSSLFLKTGCTRVCLILGSIGLLSSIGAAAAASNSLYKGLQQASKIERALTALSPNERQTAFATQLSAEKRMLNRYSKQLGATIFIIGAIATGSIVLISRKAILQEVELSDKMISLACLLYTSPSPRD